MQIKIDQKLMKAMFQSPRSGKFVSDFWDEEMDEWTLVNVFQSPRSGKFVSDFNLELIGRFCQPSFNPLDRGNLYQIYFKRNISTFREL